MIRAITERGFSGTLAQTGRDLGRFAILVLRKARRDNITLIASALAFITILSFIPLLAALSFVGERFFGRFEERTLEVLSAALPYSEEAVLRIVGESLAAARALSGFGWLALFLTALLAFPRSSGRSTGSGECRVSGRFGPGSCRSPCSSSGVRS